MQNCNETDDVDLCIVTSPNLLFTGRFLAILLSKLLRVRRPVDGACLNLFFDARDLVIPEKKRTPYVAHELLQMKPVIEKGVTYQTFRQSNRWVLDIYPNAGVPQGQPHEMSAGVISLLLQPVEQILKAIELRIIRKNRTGHLITGTQLWLFRKDFGEKLRIKR